MRYVVFDLEATCWDNTGIARKQEIIEIGACLINPFLEVEKKFVSLVKPVIHPLLSGYCKQLTGIQQFEIEKAKSFHSVMDHFLDWAEWDEEEGLYLYAWGSKDIQLLREACLQHKVDDDWIQEFTDLKSSYTRLKQLPKAVGLDRALFMEGIDFEGERHRALPDALNLAKLFVRYIDDWDI